MSDATHAYVARRACGCAVGLSVDGPRTVEDIAGWRRNGLVLSRVLIADARATPLGCVHEPAPNSDVENLAACLGRAARLATQMDCGTMGSRPDGGLCHPDRRCARCADASERRASVRDLVTLVRDLHEFANQAALTLHAAQLPVPDSAVLDRSRRVLDDADGIIR